MRFQRVPVQMANEVPEGSGVDSRQGSGRFRGRKLMRFHGSGADEVLASSGADSQKFSNIFQAVGDNT